MAAVGRSADDSGQLLCVLAARLLPRLVSYLQPFCCSRASSLLGGARRGPVAADARAGCAGRVLLLRVLANGVQVYF